MNKVQTVVSTIIQFLCGVNVILMAFGVVTFENVTADMLYEVLTPVAMFIAWGWGNWKNHNYTDKAIYAQSYLNAEKKNPHEED